MSAMTASAAATRVAASAKPVNSAKASSSRVISANAVANKRNGVGQSAQFFQGDRSTAAELRQRTVTSPVSRRSVGKRPVAASASVPAPVVQAAAPAEWKGAKLKPLGYSVLAGLIIWCIPAPAGVTAKAWHLLAVFVGTIVGIITNVRLTACLDTERPPRAGKRLFRRDKKPIVATKQKQRTALPYRGTPTLTNTVSLTGKPRRKPFSLFRWARRL